jgi:hypothetical protein
MAAAGCLETVRKIIMSPLKHETLFKLEDVIIPVLNYSFTELQCDYSGDAMGLLNSYLFKSPVISEKMWFYYPVLMYMITGIPKEYEIDNLQNINEEWRNVLEAVKPVYCFGLKLVVGS